MDQPDTPSRLRELQIAQERIVRRRRMYAIAKMIKVPYLVEGQRGAEELERWFRLPSPDEEAQTDGR